jgi:diguanylate cyclase (GGDEF)-like protein
MSRHHGPRRGEHGPGARAPWHWPVWRSPPRQLAAVLLVEVTAVVLLVDSLLTGGAPDGEQLWTAAVLVALGVVCTEASVGVERERQRLHGAGHVDLSSATTFAAVLVLPAGYAAVIGAAGVLHLWARAWHRSVPLHRHLLTVATVVLACLATRAVLDLVDPGAGRAEHPLWVLLLGMAVFALLNAGLVAVVVAVSTPSALRPVLHAWRDDHLLELGALCMGALAAIAVASSPWLVLAVLPPLLVVLRAVLVRPLEVAASTDGKTGLLTASAWFAAAERVLHGPRERAAGVLLLDLDHFKAVNDTHGHVVGDRVLAAVADALRHEVRAHDLVGRFGGEEFVVLPRRTPYGARSVELESVELEVVAERIRARVAQLQVAVSAVGGEPVTISGLSISIGGAVAPADGADLAALLQAADDALYAAKRAGRNAVRIDVATTHPSPEASPDPLRDPPVVQPASGGESRRA